MATKFNVRGSEWHNDMVGRFTVYHNGEKLNYVVAADQVMGHAYVFEFDENGNLRFNKERNNAEVRIIFGDIKVIDNWPLWKRAFMQVKLVFRPIHPWIKYNRRLWRHP